MSYDSPISFTLNIFITINNNCDYDNNDIKVGDSHLHIFL
jgi:hypothetical protein